MARFSLLGSAAAALAAAALAAAPAGASLPAPAGTAAEPGLGASLESCLTAGEAGRSAIFSATMPASPKANRLLMRFDLFTRPDIGGIWKPLRGISTFGSWDAAAPGAGGFKVTKQVNGLRLGSAYRATVSYRWLSVSGRTVRSAVREAKSCVQPDPRPDLGVAARAGSGGIVVVVRNLGRAAGAFEVKLTSAGRQLAVEKVGSLGTGRARPIVFEPVSCPAGSKVTVTVDSGSAVEERSETNNSAELRCPASG